jgi:uncharacterized protein (TIGR02145 family)
MKTFFYTALVLLLICSNVTRSKAQVVTDADGNEYGTVIIGTQVWLNASLQTTHFSNGDPIPTTSPATLNVNGELAPVYQWAYNGIDSLAPVYGRLYTWYTVADSRNVCPVGWHVPSTPEFQVLINHLGGSAVAGGKLKETGLAHWNSPNAGATNETGFTAVGNGNRNLLGYFNDMGLVSDMWSTTEGTSGAWDCDLHAGNPTTTSNDDPKGFAFAVRCIRDLPYVSSTDSTETISIYPVPAGQQLTIHIKNNVNCSYVILSVNGDLLLEGTLLPGVNILDIGNLDPGVYIIELNTGSDLIRKKFVKTS